MKKKPIIFLACIVFLAVAYLLIGNPIVLINNQKLKKSIHLIEDKTVQLNNVVPFKWDTLYTFKPYQSKQEIEEIIGFKSTDITENNINEGMVHLLFVKENKVVASILGYSDNLGYRIDFTAKSEWMITFAENVQFDVTKTGTITKLTYVKQE